MTTCPVCELEINDGQLKTCPRCGWDQINRYYLGLTEEDKQEIQAKLEQARQAWQLRQQQEALPPFRRDEFETREEFKQRIEQGNPHVAGQARLLENLYDVETGIYPLVMEWKEGSQELALENEGLYIQVESEMAWVISQEKKSYPVELLLGVPNVNTGKIRVTEMKLNLPARSLPIQQHESKSPWDQANSSQARDQWQYQLALTRASTQKITTDMDKKPVFERGIYETRTAFQKRIANQGEAYFAGTASLLKDKYDIEHKVFPIEIKLEAWLKPFPLPLKRLFIDADRDTAKALYQSGVQHPVYVGLTTKDGEINLSSLDVHGLDRLFPVRHIDEERAWWKVSRKNTAEEYTAYLQLHDQKKWLGRHQDRARNCLDKINAFNQKKKREQDEQAWAKACRLDTLQSYENYLSSEGLGQYTDQAKQRIREINDRINRENKRKEDIKIVMQFGAGSIGVGSLLYLAGAWAMQYTGLWGIIWFIGMLPWLAGILLLTGGLACFAGGIARLKLNEEDSLIIGGSLFLFCVGILAVYQGVLLKNAVGFSGLIGTILFWGGGIVGILGIVILIAHFANEYF